MAKPGKRITVATSVVTGIRIDGAFGSLSIEGVDQDKDGQTLASHQLSYPPEPLERKVAEAVATIRDFAAAAINDA